jgi:glycogenin glucosyltransferase
VKNPEEKLDELRRSSLIEFEHLKKDEHPDPPLRALPEHSVGDEAKGVDGANDSTAAQPLPEPSSSDDVSGSQQVQAGGTTFTLPAFGDDSSSVKAEGEVLSPTQTTE